HDWPARLAEIRAVTDREIWISEAGASSFGAEEVQAFGLEKTAQYLLPLVERVFWYSLLDLPAAWTATTRHKEAEGSAYYRHYYMGVARADGRPKLAASGFPPGMGICQWFHFEDPRFEIALEWLRRLNIPWVRTGISWADWFRPDSEKWFDRQMEALRPFETTVTLCFTPEHLGLAPHYTSPPRNVSDFVDFATWAVGRYAAPEQPMAQAVAGRVMPRMAVPMRAAE
ncbi:MAG: beta-xylosidase, partial [Acidobacteria bacterium]|nr:beta-xylosidase [Acidobacteriota bacterium]